jgi:5-methylthioadenosine/S-adenosylhomocysteine deaminase
MAEGRTLLPWLEERIWPLEAAHTPETLAVSVIMSLREIISTGSTGLLDMGSVEHSEVTVGILREAGIRAVACNALMDRGPDCIAKPLTWLRSESDRVRTACGGRVSYGLAPRFVLSCGEGLWEWLRSEDPGTIRTTHAAEAPGEMETPVIREAGGNIFLLQELGFLSPATCLAHCVQLQPGEVDILAGTGTAVVHCPWTNLKLGSGIADVPVLLERGITVLLGSDGAPCNNRLDLSGDLRLAINLAGVKGSPSGISIDRWNRMAGPDAAVLYGFQGFEDDTVEIALTGTEEEEYQSTPDGERYLAEIPRAGRVKRVTCGGRVIYESGEFPTLPPLPMTVKQAREKVWNRALSLGMKP